MVSASDDCSVPAATLRYTAVFHFPVLCSNANILCSLVTDLIDTERLLLTNVVFGNSMGRFFPIEWFGQ